MAETVGEYLLKRVLGWGVKRIYGYPGDGINGILGGFPAVQSKLKLVQVRHEEMAAFMACAHAKFTGEVGVCLATSGPGAIHLLNGLYDAKLDHRPVVAIIGQSATTALGGHYQQEVDLQNLFKDVASEYCQTVTSPAAVRHVIDRAFRIAQAERTVTCVIVPKDLQEEKIEQPPHAHDTIHSGIGYAMPRVVPMEKDLRRAADVLNAGKKVAMLVGAGALGCQDEITEVAELLGAGVAKALLGISGLDDRLPFVTGAIGLLGTKPSWSLMSGCDTLLMVGSSFPYSEFLPKEGQARGVQIDLDGKMLSIRYPMEVNLVGDAKETLKLLLPMLRKKTDRSWREQIEKEKRDWTLLVDEQAKLSGDAGLNPMQVFRELNKRLPDNAILAADSGSSCNWLARDIEFRRGMMASVSGNLATMGCGVPYAIAAKFAYPDRQVIACVGDGAFQMNGMNEMITVAKYWREWKTPNLIVLVLNNRDLNQVTWEMRAMSGDPKLDASQDLPDFPYARYAESIGLRGIRVDKPEQVGEAWEQALHSDRPVVLEAYTDPNTPTLPPHITLKQAKAFGSAVLSGDPEAPGFIKQTVKEAVERVLPHHKKE